MAEADLIGVDEYVQQDKCFLCDHEFHDGEEPWLLFEKRAPPFDSLSAVLSSALGRELEAQSTHSTVLCDSCNASVLEFEHLEQRFCELRYQILTTYNKTAQLHHLAPIAIEINGILQDHEEVVKIEDGEVDEFIEEDSMVISSQLTSEAAADALVEEVFDDEDDLELASFIATTDSDSKYVRIHAVIKNENQETLETPGILDLSCLEIGEQEVNIYDDIIENSQTTYSDEEASVDDKSMPEYSSNSNHTSDNLFTIDIDEAANEDQVDPDSTLRDVVEQHCSTTSRPASEQKCLKCETCQRTFTNQRLLRVHKRIHYGSAKQFECSECHKKYSSKNLLDEHMNMHTGERPFKCPNCSKDFASKYTLHAHIKIHTERQRPYQCEKCDKAFLNQQNLTQHTKLHVGVKSFICEICSKAFGTQHNLDVHKIVHSGQRPFVCRTCGKAFARRAEIKDHERIHTGEKPFQCEYCPLAFAQRSNLSSHKKSTHLNEKLHQCKQCDRSFKRRRLLDYHIQAAHTGERPHKCEICGAGFVYPEHYKKHLRIHSGQKPFACEVCGKQFNSRDNRNAHRFVHSDKKPYECIECGAGFMRKPLLLAHMKHSKHASGMDTIIVNQPQISGHGQLSLSTYEINEVDEVGNICRVEEDDTSSMVDTTESLENMMQRADSILANDDGDVITSVTGQLIKDQIGDVKYLQFEDLDGDGHQTLTWVDIGDDRD